MLSSHLGLVINSTRPNSTGFDDKFVSSRHTSSVFRWASLNPFIHVGQWLLQAEPSGSYHDSNSETASNAIAAWRQLTTRGLLDITGRRILAMASAKTDFCRNTLPKQAHPSAGHMDTGQDDVEEEEKEAAAMKNVWIPAAGSASLARLAADATEPRLACCLPDHSLSIPRKFLMYGVMR
ncbi:unnamed protein product [Protopolystoma xenopodis]|uniref:Uncharacterized protein n=1 Tax=Protopolystoma xenopodis TaxID=117903 RepID=A0A448X0T6_9PLAT|nr:unnamed protein product [Protopolystoma xenopodis]